MDIDYSDITCGEFNSQAQQDDRKVVSSYTDSDTIGSN